MMTIGLLVAASVAATRPLPADVTRFLDRRSQCLHWAGEEPFDSARSEQIAAAVRRLRCGSIEADERALRRRYVAHPDVSSALSQEDAQ